MRKTKKEIILETVEYYSVDPAGRRGYDEKLNTCLYLTQDGKMCAVGRCCIEPSTEWEGDVQTLAEDRGEEIEEGYLSIDNLLKEEYRGYDIEFWQDLQALHDGRHNWDKEGLTDSGQLHVAALLKRYS